MTHVLVINQNRPNSNSIKARYCPSFFCRLRGLMLRKSIEPYEGLLMVQPREDRLDASIHMFFMLFDIAVIWADAHLRVVDVQLARCWRPAYFPAASAKYVLETHPDRLSDFNIGDQVVLEQC